MVADDRSTFAIYHDPPLWIGSSPVNWEQPVSVDFDSFNNEVVRRTLAGGIKLRVSVEGMISFDFAAWLPGRRPPMENGIMHDMEGAANAAISRTYVMNAYLAFFYSRRILEERHGTERMVVTPELVIPVDQLDTLGGSSFNNARVTELVMSRHPTTYGPLGVMRLMHRDGPVPATVAEHAADDLANLMSQNTVEDIFLVDLFLRASKAYQDHNFSLSVITYWAVVEKLINVLWVRLQVDNKERDGKVFIDGARKKRLMDGRTFSASVMSEMLSFADYISHETYTDLSAIRKVRNDWMHSLKPVTAKDAELANGVCEQLLEQVKGYVVRGASGRRIYI